jgi:hypothetical protein
MIQYSLRIGLLVATAIIFVVPVWAEQPAEPPSPVDEVSSGTAAKTFSQQDLDQILAPIALYPDDLLAQILMASTYPLEIVQAARWQSANPSVTGKALEDAMQKQSWDASVKALTAVPQVLKQMNEKLDWTQKLGDAFLAQKSDVMATVQNLRAKADAAGNLKSTPQQNVKVEPWPTSTVYTASSPQPEKIYVIESAEPEVVYVPTYSPTVVYGSWWYPAPPYYVYPPSYVYAPGVTFAAGMLVGAAIWGDCDWHHGDVDIDVNRYNDFNKTNISNTKWNHNVEHRKGVAYQDRKVAQQYNRGANARDVQSREQFRGRTEQGRASSGFGDGGRTQGQVGTADRGASGREFGDGDRTRGQVGTSDRGAGSRDFGGSGQMRGDRGGGFSGINNGASTRAASSRGGASRSGMSRGGGGRGRR